MPTDFALRPSALLQKQHNSCIVWCGVVFAIFASKHGSSSQNQANSSNSKQQKHHKSSKTLTKNHGVSYACLEHFGVTLPHELNRTCWWRFATPQRTAAGPPPRSERRAPGRRPTTSARNPPQRDATKKTNRPQRIGSQILEFQV